MSSLPQDALELVRCFEPDRRATDVIVELRLHDGKYHSALLRLAGNASCFPDEEGTDPRHVTLDALAGLEPCTDCFPHVGPFMWNLVDNDLAAAADALYFARRYGKDLDTDRIAADAVDMEQFIRIARQFESYVENSFEEFTHSYNNTKAEYQDILDRTCGDLHAVSLEIHRATLATPDQDTMLEKYCQSVLGVAIDRRTTTIAMHHTGPKPHLRPFVPGNPSEHGELADALAVRFVYENLHRRHLVTLPIWVVESFRIAAPHCIQSSNHDLDPVLLETAKGLWSHEEGDALYMFDTAVEAATKLLSTV